MKFLLAPDKFRGSLTAEEVCSAMAEGIRLVLPAADIIMLPMADGGEGTAEILTFDANGTMLTTPVADPLGKNIQATYGISADGATAFIEMASASGLRLLEPHERNPCLTSTFGTGQLILEAIQRGATRIILGIGGSATTDAGMGMATALGWQFWDAEGQLLEPNGKNLIKIHKIVRPTNFPQIQVEVACDVTAPLYGIGGAAQLYAPQKGATPEMVAQLDKGLKHLADLVKKDFGLDLAHVPGAGAAGGLGFGALFFLGATLKEGVKIVMEQTHFAEKLEGVNWIFTGEGKIDEQTLQGKLIAGIANAAQSRGIPVVALCGALLVSPEDIRRIGLSYATSIINRPMTLDEAIANAYNGVKDASQQLTHLFCKTSKRLFQK
ncbi:glycerate kinase [Runella zeae]|uniref:glycerate kinase n=1 Tax=Runella zeae TaxID=94255 RepID=UPI0003F4C960|nr:glycerate kinase [Runella zeae]